MKRRIVVTVAIMVAVVALIPLLTYEVIGVDFTVFMENQESIGYSGRLTQEHCEMNNRFRMLTRKIPEDEPQRT